MKKFITLTLMTLLILLMALLNSCTKYVWYTQDATIVFDKNKPIIFRHGKPEIINIDSIYQIKLINKLPKKHF